jgi:hypothetical protein
VHLIKCIMFQSFELAYYVGFIPVKLLPSDLLIYFDTTSVLVFTLFLFMNATAVLASHYMQVRQTEMQFNAQCLGKWIAY